MLGNSPFYHQLLRRYVTVFGACFDDIWIVRKKTTDDSEIQRIKVPITYAPKDSYLRQIYDPTLTKNVALTLPRISFEITDIRYVANRKSNPMLRYATSTSNIKSVNAAYSSVPYDLDFQLVVYAKYIDDANAIVEQILPSFPPAFTITVDLLPDLGYKKDIPITLNSVQQEFDYETDFSKERTVMYVLKFTMPVEFFGPTTPQKIIRTVFTSLYASLYLNTNGYNVTMNLTNGNNGKFQVNDLVYQGRDQDSAYAYGTVKEWYPDSNANGSIVVTGVMGNFKADANLRAMSTNADYILASFDPSPMLAGTIKVEPDPNTVNVGEDYGYTIEIIEDPIISNTTVTI